MMQRQNVTAAEPASESLDARRQDVARRQREWAKLARLELIIALGAVCVDCGNFNLEELEIDHVYRRDWNLRRKDQFRRVSIYRREAREGKLTVRCVFCNPSKGKPAADCPF